MKQQLLRLRTLVTVMMCALTGLIFTACGDDDEPEVNAPVGDELASIVVATWAQDGDNDILSVNADGTGVGYESPTDYQNHQVGYSFNWSYREGWVYINFNHDDGDIQQEEMRAESVSKNKIVWRRYANDDSYGIQHGEYNKDAFGYYEMWTWERYNK